MKVLSVITARGGSKGLPGKNIRSFHGHPLVAWSIAHALNTPEIDLVHLSTDDVQISAVGEAYGADVRFLRPDSLSSDEAGSVEVILHVLDEFEKKGEKFDVLVLLQPTSPIRRSSDISGMIKHLQTQWDIADGVITVGHMKPSPLHSLTIEDGYVRLNESFKALPRQKLPKYFASFGVTWVIKVETLRRTLSFHPPSMVPWYLLREQCVDIDDLADFKCAEALQVLAQEIDSSFLPKFRIHNE